MTILILSILLTIGLTVLLIREYRQKKNLKTLLPAIQLILSLVLFVIAVIYIFATEGWGIGWMIMGWESLLFKILYPISIIQPLLQETFPVSSYFIVFSHFGAFQLYVYGLLIDSLKFRKSPTLNKNWTWAIGIYFGFVISISTFGFLKVHKPELINSNDFFEKELVLKIDKPKLIRQACFINENLFLSDNIEVYKYNSELSFESKIILDIQATQNGDTSRFRTNSKIRILDTQKDGSPEYLAYDYGDSFFDAKFTDLQHGISFYDENGKRKWFHKLNIVNVEFVPKTDSAEALIIGVNDTYPERSKIYFDLDGNHMKTIELTGPEVYDLKFEDEDFTLKTESYLWGTDTFTLEHKKDVVRGFYSIEIKNSKGQIVHKENLDEVGCIVKTDEGFLIGEKGQLNRIRIKKTEHNKTYKQ